MRRSTIPCAMVACLVPGGCSLSLSAFFVPPAAWAGQLFEVVVEAAASGGVGEVAAVLQLPNGFVVDRAYCFSSVGGASPVTLPTGGTRDDPAVLALYTAEPGHYLASFSGTGSTSSHASAGSGFLSVLVRAPATAGAHTIKVALAGQNTTWQATSPANVTAFSAITVSPFAQPITVTASTGLPFAIERIGTAPPPPFGLRTDFATGDVDGDGNDDFAMRDNGSDRLWLSRPGGGWVEQSQGLPGPAAVGGLAFGHFDNDPFLDLLSDGGRVWFGNGGTAWTPGPILALPSAQGGGAAAGDVDGDGIDDIAYASSAGIQVFRSIGNRTFAAFGNGLPTSPGATGGQVLLADATGDGRLDLLTTLPYALGSGFSMVYAGDGLGNWSALPGLPPFWRCGVGDVDGNGSPDVLVARQSTGTSGHLAGFAWSGAAWAPLPLTFPPLPLYLLQPVQVAELALLDFDRDGRLDVVVCEATAEGTMHLWRNQGNLTFAALLPSGLAQRQAMQALATADVDGDSFPDLVGFGASPVAFTNMRTGLSPFGVGCTSAPFTLPTIAITGNPAVGSPSFAWQLAGGQPNSAGIFALGFDRRLAFGNLPLPAELSNLGAPGCHLLVAQDSVVLRATDNAGAIAVAMPIPNIAALSRFTVFAQCAMLAPGANAFGATFSAGAAVKIQ